MMKKFEGEERFIKIDNIAPKNMLLDKEVMIYLKKKG